MRPLCLAIATLTLLASAPLPSYGQSQAEMNMESGKRLEKADAELNKVYKQVLAQNEGDKEFSAVIKESQRAWLKYVELQMKVLFFVKEGENPREVYGSVYPTEFAEAKAALITARTKELKEMLEE
jgi:uncharacterized protein YecT (DUF1311 family)